MAGEIAMTGALAGLQTGTAGVIGTVWTAENEISSNGETRDIPLPDLFEESTDPRSRFVHVTGTTPTLGGLFRYQPYSPQSPTVTNDPFDQVAVFHFLSRAYHYLGGLGFNMEGIIGSKHGGVPHPIRAKANDMPDINAYYNPGEDVLAFGTAGDKWHLANDGDIVVHEGGHLVLDHINPGLGGWGTHEGGAIHEGFGDALAALLFNDGQMSEVFPVFDGSSPDKNAGLRIVDNDLTLSTAGEEIHDRGRVYAGFFWSLYETFVEKGKLQEEEARALASRLLLHHAFHYSTSRPQPNDFVDAVIGGAKALGREQKLSLPLEVVTEMIETEAKRRELRSETGPKPKPKKRPYRLSVEGAQQHHIKNSGGAVSFSPVSSAPYIGGTFSTYQQRYTTKDHGVVDVVGHGMQARLNANGKKAVAILDDDVRPMQTGEVDETTLIPFDEALKKVADLVQRELDQGQRDLRRIEMNFRPTQEMVYEWKERSGHVLTFKLCRQSFTQATPQIPKYVVLNSDNELSYEFDLGFAVFYVNTRTGVVQFSKKIFF